MGTKDKRKASIFFLFKLGSIISQNYVRHNLFQNPSYEAHTHFLPPWNLSSPLRAPEKILVERKFQAFFFFYSLRDIISILSRAA
jgi:hypothetical protein